MPGWEVGGAETPSNPPPPPRPTAPARTPTLSSPCPAGPSAGAQRRREPALYWAQDGDLELETGDFLLSFHPSLCLA